MAIKHGIFCLLVFLFTGSAGCGLIYTNHTRPYTNDFNNTAIGSKHFSINDHRIREPVSRVRVGAEWDTGKVAQAARDAGITKIHYIDLRTFSILLGTYRKRTLIVYGD